MYDKPYDRKFGIEFEFNIPSIGIGWENKFGYLTNLLDENGFGDFSIGSDGSEFEVRTPILSGPNGFKRVKNFLELLLSVGAATNYNDGLHVHHDAPEFIGNKNRIVRLVENWVENQSEIFKMVRSDRINSRPCTSWENITLNLLKTTYGQPNTYFGRRNLNISSLNNKGSIEVRLHEGTLNYEEVFSWVRFGQAFIAKALEETEEILAAAENPSALLKKINVSRNASRFITKKSRTLYGNV